MKSVPFSRLFILFLQHATEGESFPARFEDGKTRIKEKIRRTKSLYEKITDNYQSFQVDSIDLTIKELGNFFLTYDIEYGANQEGKVWIDYQLGNPADTTRQFGIDFIADYLDRFYQEMTFLQQFSEEAVARLLRQYQKQLKFDYTKDINNIYEVVFIQAVAKAFAGNCIPQGDLLLRPFECEYIFSNQKFMQACPAVLELVSENPYYEASLGKFLLKLQMISSPADLTSYLVCQAEDEKQRVELLPPMPEKEFVELAEKIASHPDEASDLIYGNVHSPYDLADLLEGNMIDEKEVEKVFARLPLILFSGFILLFLQQDISLEASVEALESMDGDNAVSLAIRSRVTLLKEDERGKLQKMLESFDVGELDYS